MEILGHEKVLSLLERAAMKPASGYLFYGPSGVGKKLVGMEFAAKLLSVNREQLAAHPDFVALRREVGDKNIKIEAVKEMVARMNLTSAIGGRKVALIENAEALREDATNALLKAVEEPNGEAIFIFITEQLDRLPATLRSRLAQVRFNPVPVELVEKWLAPSKFAHDAAVASQGSPGLAKRFVEDPDAWQIERQKATSLLTCLGNEPVGRQLGELERLAKAMNAAEDPETAWKDFLAECERQASTVLGASPEVLTRVGRGLIRAQHLAGGPLSPHLALEWSVVEPYHVGDIPSFLHPSYL